MRWRTATRTRWRAKEVSLRQGLRRLDAQLVETINVLELLERRLGPAGEAPDGVPR
jgi:hypothetical protein